MIERTTDHMNELLENVLTVSRWEAGKITLKSEPIDMQPFCQRLVERFRVMCESTHVLKFTIVPEQFSLTADPTLFEHILSNLLSNAIKYSPNGGTVSFEVRAEDDTVTFRVSDQGLGISEADQQSLFDTFHRGENVGNIKGTGLGLSIVKRLIELHHGTIHVDSALNKGSTFIVTIPRTSDLSV